MEEIFNSFPYIGALTAGILSFLSPCVLPLIPSYLTFISGVSFDDMQIAADKKRIQFLTVSHSLLFILGFSAVFIALGASSSLVGRLFSAYQDWVRIIGGAIMIFFGLFVAGVFRISFLQCEKKFHLQKRPVGFLGSIVIGMAFAAGWTPCIGPILGTILLFASSQESTAYGVRLLSMYSLGLAIPFLFASLAFNSFLSYSKWIRSHMRIIMIASGLLLIGFGLLLLTNKIIWITTLFQ
jgi:cytochrome c-type biogenesis protein